jgi:two-component system nitrogen regulation sensor histidine kinase NtrY
LEKTLEKDKEKQKRQREKRIIIATFILLIIATIIQVYYAKITFNNTPLPSNIVVFSLLNINIILLLLLVFLIFRNLVKIFFNKEQRKFKKLSRKLVTSFFLFTTIPLILQFAISSVIIKSTITGWFNKKIEDSLVSSLKIAQDYYEEKTKKTIIYAKKLYKVFKINRNLLETKAKDYLLDGYFVGTVNNVILSKYFNKKITKYLTPNFKKIVSFVLNSNAESGSDIIQINKKEIVYGYFKGKKYFSVAIIVTSRKFTKSAKTISQNFTEFSYLKLMKSPVEKTYIFSLLIVTLVIILSATWFGIFIANDISTPINKLVKATEEVAKGNLEQEINIKSQDEIRILVDSFKKMVEEIKTSRKDLMERQHYIESIINNVNNGVISLNKNGIINTVNPFVIKLLKLEPEAVVGIHYNSVKHNTLKQILSETIEEFKLLNKTVINKNLNINLGKNFIMLSMFGTILKDEKNEVLGYLIVISDMTQITLAQRTAAWKEVARRVAHEIKNPLTPIQLSAQRLKRKYAEKIQDNKEEFEKTTNNIIQYVDVIRNLVNEFSRFTKLPEIKMETHNLNNILKEIIPSFKNIKKDINFITNLDNNLPNVNIDKKQIYQVVTNIINNSIQSFEKSERKTKKVEIKTKYIKYRKVVLLQIRDNGCGIDDAIKEKIFEPYFSTKSYGTGIGLTIVKSIIDSHNGKISVKDNKPYGTTIEIEFTIT